jgi:hypothetical protein
MAAHVSRNRLEGEIQFLLSRLDAFRSQKGVLPGIFAFAPLRINGGNTTVGINGQPTLADGMMVTGQYFSTLGVTPLLGRGLTESDENPGAPRTNRLPFHPNSEAITRSLQT